MDETMTDFHGRITYLNPNPPGENWPAISSRIRNAINRMDEALELKKWDDAIDQAGVIQESLGAMATWIMQAEAIERRNREYREGKRA